MPTRPVRHVSVGVALPPDEVYSFLADPANFPQWASGLGHSFRHAEGMDWTVETPEGPMRVRFSERNAFGVLDHSVTPEGGAAMHNPMRVVANGDGSEVMFCVFQRPEMSDKDLARDADAVSRDLLALKEILESGDR